METKNKIIKAAKVCYKTSKILYYVSFVLCLLFIVLTILLSSTKGLKGFSATETVCLFGTLALYSFICIGLLWNVVGIFKSVEKKAPFSDGVSKYLKKSAVFILMLAVVPAIIGSTILRIAQPSTQLVFPISVGGIIAGLVMLMLGMFFNYGAELQTKDDETL